MPILPSFRSQNPNQPSISFTFRRIQIICEQKLPTKHPKRASNHTPRRAARRDPARQAAHQDTTIRREGLAEQRRTPHSPHTATPPVYAGRRIRPAHFARPRGRSAVNLPSTHFASPRCSTYPRTHTPPHTHTPHILFLSHKLFLFYIFYLSNFTHMCYNNALFSTPMY